MKTVEEEVLATSHVHYSMTIAMLNNSMGLCLRWGRHCAFINMHIYTSSLCILDVHSIEIVWITDWNGLRCSHWAEALRSHSFSQSCGIVWHLLADSEPAFLAEPTLRLWRFFRKSAKPSSAWSSKPPWWIAWGITESFLLNIIARFQYFSHRRRLGPLLLPQEACEKSIQNGLENLWGL